MAKPREKHIADRDRIMVQELYLKGYSSRQIAEKISEKYHPYSINFSTVTRDIKWLLSQWLKESIDDINKLKVRELEKINKLEQTYWEAWEKSVEDYKKKAVKVKGNVGSENPKEQEVATIEMVSMGNPAYLAGIERCIQMRCKILGVEAVQKLDMTSNGKTINQVTAIEVVHTSKDELDARNKDAGNSGVSEDQGGIQFRKI